MATALNSYEVITDYNGDPDLVGYVFSMGESPYQFTDAIIARQGEMTQAQIDAEIQRRYDSYIYLINSVGGM